MGHAYRAWWAGTGLLLALLASPALGVEYRLESRTLLRSFERDTPEQTDAALLPAYQYLQLGADSRRLPGLSFYLYGWGRVNLGDDGWFEEQTEGEILDVYLRYRPPGGGFELKAGRFYIFEGVANESVDGVALRLFPRQDVSLSVYGGLPVSLATENGREGDRLGGGRLSWQVVQGGQLGLSYKIIESDGARDEERAGVDFALPLPAGLTLMGTSVRNLVESIWAEHFYELRIGFGPFELRPFYQKYDYRGLLSERENSSPPFRFLATLDNAVEIIGSEAYWFPGEQTEIGVKAKLFDYDMRLDRASYLAGLFTWRWSLVNQLGAEVGRMDGDGERNRYWLSRGYFNVQLPADSFFTGDLIYVYYDQPIYHEDDSFSLSLGGGRRFLADRLCLKLAAIYSSDPVFENDYRYTVIAEYLLP